MKKKPRQLGIGYIGEFEMTNAHEIGFTRRKLVECLLSPKIAEKLRSQYLVIRFKRRILPFDNPSLTKDLMETFRLAIKAQILSEADVETVMRHRSGWSVATHLICDKFGLVNITAFPTTKTITEIVQLRTNGEYPDHVHKMMVIRHLLGQAGIRFWEHCYAMGPCATNNSEVIRTMLKDEREKGGVGHD